MNDNIKRYQEEQKKKIAASYTDTNKNEIKKGGEDDEIEKSGEGSRGGQVVGHTSSGKPIYNHFNHESHSSFTKQDHHDASKIHEKLGSEALHKKDYDSFKHHDRQFADHGDKADSMKGKIKKEGSGYNPSEDESYHGHDEHKRKGTTSYTTGGIKKSGNEDLSNDIIKSQIANTIGGERLSDEEIEKSANDYFEKGGKQAVIGERRTFGGREYIKTADGWKFHGKGTGAKAQEHTKGALGHHVDTNKNRAAYDEMTRLGHVPEIEGEKDSNYYPDVDYTKHLKEAQDKKDKKESYKNANDGVGGGEAKPSVDEMEKELKDSNFFTGGLTDEQIKQHYNARKTGKDDGTGGISPEQAALKQNQDRYKDWTAEQHENESHKHHGNWMRAEEKVRKQYSKHPLPFQKQKVKEDKDVSYYQGEYNKHVDLAKKKKTTGKDKTYNEQVSATSPMYHKDLADEAKKKTGKGGEDPGTDRSHPDHDDVKGEKKSQYGLTEKEHFEKYQEHKAKAEEYLNHRDMPSKHETPKKGTKEYEIGKKQSEHSDEAQKHYSAHLGLKREREEGVAEKHYNTVRDKRSDVPSYVIHNLAKELNIDFSDAKTKMEQFLSKKKKK